MSRIFKLTVLAYGLLISLVFGCSVYKASFQKGVHAYDVKACKNRYCLLSHGMRKVDSTVQENKIIETYVAPSRDPLLSGAFRATLHATMDVITYGLWEAIGSPVEGIILNSKHYIVAKATFSNKDIDSIDKLEIYNHLGVVK